MNAFLPGSGAIGASKLPRPNSAITPIASFFTAMCAATISLTPRAITRKSPSKRWVSITTSMSPFSCSLDMWFISAISPFRLPRTFSMVSLMKAFLPGSGASGASKLPLPNSATTPIASFFTAMCALTRSFTPTAISRSSPAWRCGSITTSMSPRSCSARMRSRSSRKACTLRSSLLIDSAPERSGAGRACASRRFDRSPSAAAASTWLKRASSNSA